MSVDPKSAAEEAKKKGNEAFLRGDHSEAISQFTTAVSHDPTNSVLFSNRSAAHAARGDYASALSDADRAVELKPEWSRAHSRRATALHFLGRLTEARESYLTAMKLDPKSADSLKSSLDQLDADIRARQESENVPPSAKFDPSKIFSGDVMGTLRSDARTAAFADDPEFVAAIAAMQKNPKDIMKYASDPRIVKALEVILRLPAEDAGQKKEEVKEEKAERPKEKEEEKGKEEVVIPEEKREAEKLKDEGNRFYKGGKLEEASACYRKACEIFADDATYRANLSASLLEMGKAEECLQECERALEDARRLRQYQLVPKLLNRMGAAHTKLGKLAEAVVDFQKSLTECRCADTLAKLQKAEKAKKEADEKAYLSPTIAVEERNRGNELFKSDHFPEAIKAYEESLRRNPDDHVTYSNRAAAYMKMGEYPTALKDIEKCLSIKPDFVKGFTRKGACHFFMKEYHKAMTAYEEGLKIEPTNQECLEGITKVEQTVAAQQGTSEADQEQLKHAMADPEIRIILQDPIMQQVLHDLQTDPKHAQHHLKNPDIMSRIQKLVAAGVIRLA